jgi:hypothetical protein
MAVVRISDLRRRRTRGKGLVVQCRRCPVTEQPGLQVRTVVMAPLLPSERAGGTTGAAAGAAIAGTGTTLVVTTLAVSTTAVMPFAAQSRQPSSATIPAAFVHAKDASGSAATGAAFFTLGTSLTARAVGAAAHIACAASGGCDQQTCQRCDPQRAIHLSIPWGAGNPFQLRCHRARPTVFDLPYQFSATESSWCTQSASLASDRTKSHHYLFRKTPSFPPRSPLAGSCVPLVDGS